MRMDQKRNVNDLHDQHMDGKGNVNGNHRLVEIGYLHQDLLNIFLIIEEQGQFNRCYIH